jgi:hypothetical protein
MERADAASNSEAVELGTALAGSIDKLTRLNRYEVSISRELSKARAELERLQDRRLQRRRETISPGDEPSPKTKGEFIDLSAKEIG